MQFNPMLQLLTTCLEQVMSGDAGQFIENPATEFTKKAKAGDYDSLSDEEYYALLHKIEALAAHWHKQPRRKAGDILLAILGQTMTSQEDLDGIAKSLTECYNWGISEQNDKDCEDVFEQIDVEDIPEDMFVSTPCTPAQIRDSITERVIGQPEAAKAAAMITYHHLAGRRTNAVFCGPSGCGKSETWRCLSKEYPGLIRIMDFSRMSGEGWAGSLHLRDVFEGVNLEDIQQHGLIVVLDEADKILCETAISSSGNNHNLIVQNSLLKMLDGDVIEFGSEGGKASMSIDCSKVSVVMLGAFETLLSNKSAGTKHIGFNAAPTADPGSHKNISYNDLINAGMRREIAGRVNKIVALSPLTADGYMAILRGPVLSDLQESIGCQISIDDAAVSELAAQAIQSGLGVRWMRSAIQNAIDDAMFDACEAENYSITMRDGALCCQAQIPCEEDSADSYRLVPDIGSGLDGGPDSDDCFDLDDGLPF